MMVEQWSSIQSKRGGSADLWLKLKDLKVAIKDWCARVVSCRIDKLPATYLGLPMGARGNSVTIWDPVVKKFEQRLSGWKANKLSLSGRVTLIKSVLANLPNYYMSLFQMPASIKEKLDRIQRRFLCGSSQDTRKIHWVDWNAVCNDKAFGGLGMVDLSLKNRALLNKWFWRFAKDKESLWRKPIVGKYGGDEGSLLPDTRGYRRFSNQ
ncbi:hypothetical protein PTKIN_Ptkin01aG0017800 [Pterospermum kingtungense]